MTDGNIELTRRKLLASTGAVGVAGAGAALGTSAYFTDEESFEDNELVAGELDLYVHYETTVDQGGVDTGSTTGSGTIDGDPAIGTYGIDDVKPGDSGGIECCFSIVDNPAYLWMCGELTANDENGYTEPEPNSAADGDANDPGVEDGEGELADAVKASLYYYEDGDAGDTITDGTLGEVLDDLGNGVPLDGDGNGDAGVEREHFDGGEDAEEPTDETCVYLAWEVPTSVGNEIQTDSVAFDLAFHAEQARHNDGTNNPCGDVDEGVPDAVSISASPNAAGETDSIHRVEVPVGSGLDGVVLSTITVDYPADFDIGGVDPSDVLGAGVERTDTSIEFVSIFGTSAGDGATAIEFSIDGSVTVSSGDTIFVEYRDVTNASTADDYTVVVDVNGSEIGPGTLAIVPASGTPGPVTSTFETDDDGWQITGDAQGGASVPDHEPSRGNPEPSISATDDVQGGVWYFKAPGKFLGDKSGFYGGTLEFDLMQEFSGSPSQFDSADIILSGGGLELTYDTDQHPGGGTSETWTSYSVTLDGGDDWEEGGSPATESQIQTVLADLTELRIRGEYRSGSDKGYLDNVTMST